MKRCPTCDKVVQRGHGFKSDTRYCSYKCFRELTPKMVEIQEYYKKSVRETIIDLLSYNNNITVTAELLEITKTQLHLWLKKFNITRVVEWK